MMVTQTSTVLTLPRSDSFAMSGDQGALGLIAEFAALLALPVISLPAVTQTPQMRKPAADDAMIALADLPASDEVSVQRVATQSPVSDQPSRDDVTEQAPLQREDLANFDAVMAYLMASPILTVPDAKVCTDIQANIAATVANSSAQNTMTKGAGPPDLQPDDLVISAVDHAVLASQSYQPDRSTNTNSAMAFPLVSPTVSPRQSIWKDVALPDLKQAGPPRLGPRPHPATDHMFPIGQAPQGFADVLAPVSAQTVVTTSGGPALPLKADRTALQEKISPMIAKIPPPVQAHATTSSREDEGTWEVAVDPWVIGQDAEGQDWVTRSSPSISAAGQDEAGRKSGRSSQGVGLILPVASLVSKDPGKIITLEQMEQAPVSPLVGTAKDVVLPILAQTTAASGLMPTFADQSAGQDETKPPTDVRMAVFAVKPMQRGTVPENVQWAQTGQEVAPQRLSASDPAVQQAGGAKAISISSDDAPPKAFDLQMQTPLAVITLPPSLPIDAPPALAPKSAVALHAQLSAVIDHLQHGAARSGQSHAELLMNPAELGRIRFDLITQGDQVQVTLAVERPETLDLLRANAEALRQEFRAAGLNADTLNFGQWSQRTPRQAQPEVSFEQAVFAAAPQAIPFSHVTHRSTSGLDLRL